LSAQFPSRKRKGYVGSSATRLYQNPGLVDTYEPNGEIRNGEWRFQVPQQGMMIRTGRLGANNPTRVAIIQRNKLRDYFLTEEGEILWQYHHTLRNVPIIRQSI